MFKAYSQLSEVGFFAEMSSVLSSRQFFVENSILDVWLDSEHASIGGYKISATVVIF